MSTVTSWSARVRKRLRRGTRIQPVRPEAGEPDPGRPWTGSTTKGAKAGIPTHRDAALGVRYLRALGAPGCEPNL
jgi:hypothetical protein